MTPLRDETQQGVIPVWVLMGPVRLVAGTGGTGDLPSPSPSPEEAWEASLLTDAAAAELVQAVGGYLNEVHGCHHSLRYWDLAIGHWIRELIRAIWWRQAVLDTARSALGGQLQVEPGAHSDEARVPFDTAGALALLTRDGATNERVFQTLLDPDLRPQGQPSWARVDGSPAKSDPRSASGSPSRRFMLRHQATTGKTLLFGAGWPGRQRAAIACLAAGRVWPAVNFPVAPVAADRRLDMGLRSGLAALPASSPLTRAALAVYADLAPLLVLEGHEDLHGTAEALLRGTPRAIVAPPRDDVHMHWYAEAADRGSEVVFVQHGGFYGESIPDPMEQYESHAGDRLLTWGWAGPKAEAVAAARLITFRSLVKRATEPRVAGNILWVTQELTYTGSTPPFESPKEYEQRQRDLAAALAPSAAGQVLVRLRPPRAGVDPMVGYEWLQEAGFRVDAGAESLPALLAAARLVIVDRAYSTSFLQCLVADVPVIVVAPGAIAFARPSVRSILQGLAEVGVLESSTAVAATTVNLIADGPQAWWQEPRRRRAVAAARHHLARTGRAPLRSWAATLRRLGKSGTESHRAADHA